MKELLNLQKFRKAWSREIAKYGPLKQYSIADMGAENDPYRNNVYGVYITCKFERATKCMVVKFNRNRQVNFFDVRDTAAGTR